MKRRDLAFLMPFMALAPMEYARAAIKKGALPGCEGTPAAPAPYIRASELVLDLLGHSLLPAANAFAQHSHTLHEHLRTRPWADCRAAWVNSMLAWETLSAVPVDALLERRSARTVDFWPTRPAQIQVLLDAGTTRFDSPQALQTIGASAKGLPALEWLLFRNDGSAPQPALAVALAEQVLLEARTLEQAYTALHQTTWDEADAWSAYGNWFGQAVGSLEQLRLKKLKANTRGKDSAIWVRGVSGQTRAAWQAQARALQAFFTGPLDSAPGSACHAALPLPGTLHSLLLGRRYPREAERLQVLTRAMVQALHQARPENTASLQRAQQSLAGLHRYVSDLGSELFDFSLGFTDADGD
ncbi:imelysin family protein [Rhodoferax bucti]|uniref:imelysin family protein n=1 Tax=Rhodoferax bucti TaxID=2576305 RepID=UPI0011087D41|nr:imelysin family protein [Rhodoferax bucti]